MPVHKSALPAPTKGKTVLARQAFADAEKAKGKDKLGVGSEREEISKAGSGMYAPFYMRPYNSADLYRKKSNYTLYDEIRQDDQVSAALAMKKTLMVGKGWEVSGTEDDEKEKEIADFVTDALRDVLPGGGLDSRLHEILTALDYGVSITEWVADIIPDGRWKGKMAFRALKTRPPHGILLHTDEHGNLTKLTQDNVEMPPEKFIIYAHNAEFGNPYGKSDINTGVYRAWWSKDRIIGFQNMALERFGMPTLHGKHDPTFTDDDQAKFLQVLKNVQARTAIVTPKGAEISVIEGKADGGSGGAYQAAINAFNVMIARAVLVPDLAGMSGEQTGGGSYSLGAKQFEMFYLLLGKERIQIEQAVNTELVKRLYAWNYGDWAMSGIRFKLKPLTESDKAAMATQWLNAVKANVWKPSDDEIKHFIEATGFPVPDEIERPEPPAQLERFGRPVDGATGKNAKDASNDDEPTAPGAPPKPKVSKAGDSGESGDKPKEYAAKEGDEPLLNRAPTKHEKRVNFALIKRETATAEQTLKERMAGIIRDAVKDMTATVQRRKVIEGKKLALAGTPPFKASFEAKLRVAVREQLNRVLDMGYDRASEEVGKKTYRMVEGVQGLEWSEVKDLLDDIATNVAHAEWETLANISTPILQEAIRKGLSVKDTMAQLDEAYRGYDIEFGADRLETTVRTNIGRVYNSGRNAAFDEASDDIVAYQFSAILDARTTDICSALDEAIISPEERDKFTPPLLWNCRSLLVPIMTGEPFEFSVLPAVRQVKGGFLELA